MGERIAVFDYRIIPTNPIGGCHLHMLRNLCHEYEFTVFAVEFENPAPERIRWVRIPALTRPLALLFVLYHLLAPIYYWVYRLKHRVRYSKVQIVGSDVTFGDITYVQFCNRTYLKHYWKLSRARGLRGGLRWLNHWLRSIFEPLVFRHAAAIVVPSQGLARELATEYPFARANIHIIPNPVDIERMRPPEGFDRSAWRQTLALGSADVALVFVALGHFERKGLPLLLEAYGKLDVPYLKLLVVGGERDLIAAYQARVEHMGLSSHVRFTGMQRDVRPYLWASDAFVFPSFYEAFPLVSLEAAAAGLPLLATPVNGIEEFLRDGENGILLTQTPEGVATGLKRFLALPPEARRGMGRRAEEDAQHYRLERFVTAWRDLYAGEKGAPGGMATATAAGEQAGCLQQGTSDPTVRPGPLGS
jgi:glycosyltransferase involved in cell wall biosynthesis